MRMPYSKNLTNLNQNKMKKLLFIASFAIVLASCKSSKHIGSDAYKTYYKPIKAEHHKHPKCDAYN